MATANVSPNATSDQIDPHLAWAARAKQLQAERELLRDDAVRDAKADALGELWELVGSTKARTLAGARVQIECVAEQLVTGVSGERERAALANAAATLDRLGAASAILAKFEEVWELLGGGWDGDGGEQILAREIRDGLRHAGLTRRHHHGRPGAGCGSPLFS